MKVKSAQWLSASDKLIKTCRQFNPHHFHVLFSPQAKTWWPCRTWLIMSSVPPNLWPVILYSLPPPQPEAPLHPRPLPRPPPPPPVPLQPTAERLMSGQPTSDWPLPAQPHGTHLSLCLPACLSPPSLALSNANAAVYNCHIDFLLPLYVNTICSDQWTERWHDADHKHTRTEKNPHKQADTQLSAKCENRMKFKNLLFVELVSVFPPCRIQQELQMMQIIQLLE